MSLSKLGPSVGPHRGFRRWAGWARFAVAYAWGLEHRASPLGRSLGSASARPEDIEGGAEDLS
jgi:hypothetical protein